MTGNTGILIPCQVFSRGQAEKARQKSTGRNKLVAVIKQTGVVHTQALNATFPSHTFYTVELEGKNTKYD